MKKYIVIELDRGMTCPTLVNRSYEGEYSYSNKAKALAKAKMYKCESKNRKANMVYAVVTSDFCFEKYHWDGQTFPKVNKEDCIYLVEW